MIALTIIAASAVVLGSLSCLFIVLAKARRARDGMFADTKAARREPLRVRQREQLVGAPR